MAVYEVQAPDGSILEIEGPDDATDEQISAYAESQFGRQQPSSARPKQQPAPQQTGSGYTARDALAPWDAGLHFASGMVAGPAAGLAGIAGAMIPGVNAADVVEAVQEKMTYQPRTKLGGQMADAAGSVLSLPAQWGDAAGKAASDASGSPALGTAANVAVQSIPAIIGSRGVAAMRNRAIAREEPSSVTNDTLRAAVDNDYRIPPSMAGARTGPLEAMAGTDALMRDIQRHNARTVNNAVRRDADIPGTGQIRQEQIRDVAIPREQAAYGRMRTVSQNASDVVDAIQQLGGEMRAMRRIDARNPTAETAAALQQSGRQMDLYHQMLEAEANAAQVPQLAADMRAARVSLGRIGSVERALNESTGNVSAKDLARQREQGVPIDRNPGMSTAARMAEIDGGVLVREPQLFNRSDRGFFRTAADFAGWPLRQALLSRMGQAMARPSDPLPSLSAAEQMQRAALIEALMQQENQ